MPCIYVLHIERGSARLPFFGRREWKEFSLFVLRYTHWKYIKIDFNPCSVLHTEIICRPTLKYLCVWHHIFIKIVTLKLHRSSIFSKIASHNNYHKKFVSKGQQLGELCNERLSSMKICGILQEQISSIIQTKNQFLCPTLWLI